jgi:RNA polymerase sigma-70 factor (ECF subfamily)
MVQDFEEIYNLYFKDVYRYVFSVCKNANIAEEVTQETFFKALKSINSFNGSCKISVWLCQIARNTYYTLYQKEKKLVSLPDENTMAFDDVESNFFDKETANLLHVLLHNLNEPYKEVFTLRVFGDLSFSKIGELFGKSDSWARVVFYRAKTQLKEDIE